LIGRKFLFKGHFSQRDFLGIYANFL